MVSRPEEVPSGKAPFAPEHGVDQVRLSDPQISPDGSLVAYVVTPVAQAHEHPTAEIWVVPFVGGEARRFTRGPRADSAPRWSPDGRRLAFISDRDQGGKSQLYVISMSGGEAVRLTDRHSGVSDPSWSPDGRWLAFLSADEESEQDAEDKEERRDQVVADADLKRNRLYLVSPSGAGAMCISPHGSVNVWEFCWSPDGRRIAIVTTSTPKLADYRAPHHVLLGSVPSPSSPQPIEWHELFTFDSDVEAPSWSPDERRLAFLGRGGRIITGDALHVASVESGTVELLTKGYEGSVIHPQWQGKRIVFSALENLHGAINRLDLERKQIRSVLPKTERYRGTFGTDLALSPNGRFAVVRSRMSEPPELYCGVFEREMRPVTRVNERLRVHLRPAEETSWRAPDGKMIHGLLVTPGEGASG